MYLKDDDFTTINGMLSTKPVARLPDEAMRSRVPADLFNDQLQNTLSMRLSCSRGSPCPNALTGP